MIEVTIANLDGVMTNQARWPDQPSAAAWVTTERATGAFGRDDRWVSEDDLEAEGEDKTKAIESQSYTADSEGTTKMNYHFAAEFTVSYTDVSAEVAQATALAKGLQAQALGAQVVAAVFALNESADITAAQLQALMSDPAISLIERLCWNGSLISARTMIAALPNTFFTAAQVTEVLALVDGYIAQLAAFHG